MLGGREAGLTKLGQLAHADLDLDSADNAKSFSDVLGRVLGRSAAVPARSSNDSPGDTT